MLVACRRPTSSRWPQAAWSGSVAVGVVGRRAGTVGQKPRERLITMWPMTDDAVASRTYPRFGRPPSRFLPLFAHPSRLPSYSTIPSTPGGGVVHHVSQRHRFRRAPRPQRSTFNSFPIIFPQAHPVLLPEDCHYPLRWFPQGHPKSTLLNNLSFNLHLLTRVWVAANQVWWCLHCTSTASVHKPLHF